MLALPIITIHIPAFPIEAAEALCLRACSSSALLQQSKQFLRKTFFPSLLGGSLAPRLSLPRPRSWGVVGCLPSAVVPRAPQESTPICFQNRSHFWPLLFTVFGQTWGRLLKLFRDFFCLGGDLVEAAFLKHFPIEI